MSFRLRHTKTQTNQNQMNKLTSAQKTKVREFQDFTGASDEVSIDLLKRNNWNIEQAADSFFANPPPEPEPVVDINKIKALFVHYAGSSATKIEVGGGLEKLLTDLHVDSEDIGLFIFAWQIKATVLGEFSKKEWEEGLLKLGVDSIETFRERLGTLRAQVHDDESFKQFYSFLFEYALAKDAYLKTLDLSAAIVLWRIVLKDRFVNLEKWCKFLTEQYKKSISKDTWNQLFEFVRLINNDIEKYDPDGAWPVVIDEFVAYLKN